MFRIFFVSIIFFIAVMPSCKTKQTSAMPSDKSFAIRLKPGADLKKSIQAFVDEHQLQAAWVVTCAGSLTGYQIRFANQPAGNSGTGHYEIVSLGGTLSVNGSHLHISISDSTGHTIGGHLMEGCIVYTTAEIIIQSSTELIFTRKKDGTTAWEELQVENN